MDYEKAYNEALQLARTYYDKGTNEFLDTIFPELRDIEDERIRKAIKCYVEDMPDTYGFAHGIGKKEMLSYLEKQKINTDGDFGRGYNCGYECCLNSHGAEWFEKQKEQKTEPFSCGHENGSSEKPNNQWSEEDEKMRENLLYLMLENNSQDSWEGAYDWLKSIRPQPHWKPSEEQMNSLHNAIVRCKGYSDTVHLPELYEELKQL